MPNPKKKFSKARRSQRRAVYYNRLKTEVPVVTTCPECGAPQQAHRACGACGTYRGRKVLTVADAA